jgi:hypothetical protein
VTLKLLFFNITSIMTNAPIFNPKAMAQWLVLQHANQTVFQTAPTEMSPVDVAQATAVQNELVRIKSQHCGPTVGWKIALATPVMQQMVGLHAPIAGRLHAKQVIHSPASVVAKGYGRLLIEFEIKGLPKIISNGSKGSWRSAYGEAKKWHKLVGNSYFLCIRDKITDRLPILKAKRSPRRSSGIPRMCNCGPCWQRMALPSPRPAETPRSSRLKMRT